jgi:hypothetical protein
MKKPTLKPTEEDMATKVILSVSERIHFPSIMPRSSNTAGIALGRAIKNRVMLTPDEIKEYDMRSLPDRRVAWNPKAPAREFRFEDYELLHIQAGARFLEENELVEETNDELVKKFLAIVVKKKE